MGEQEILWKSIESEVSNMFYGEVKEKSVLYAENMLGRKYGPGPHYEFSCGIKYDAGNYTLIMQGIYEGKKVNHEIAISEFSKRSALDSVKTLEQKLYGRSVF